MSVGDIVLRKDECFWIFPAADFYDKNIYSPWFSYLGVQWHLDKKKRDNPNGWFDINLRVKSRYNLAKCKYAVQLNLKTNCKGCGLSSSAKNQVVDSDYGCQFQFRCKYSCGYGFSIFTQNELAKFSFVIQKEKNINNATDKKNWPDDESSENEDDESSENEDDESSENEDDESCENEDDETSDNEDDETSDNEVIEIMSSADKNSNENKTVAAKSEGITRLAENFKQLFLDGRLSDVVLKVDSREFNVHKLVLVARSPVFASMFEHDLAEKNTNVVDIPDCVAESFEVFLYYLYSGSTETMSVSNVYNVYYAADKYRIDDLRKQCVKFMKMNLSVETFCDTISLSLRHGESELKKKSISYFCKNIKKIIKTVQWQTYLAENSTHANELLIKALKA